MDGLEIFPWNENFETGIQKIDDEHKQLIKLINKLANALTQEESEKIEAIFDELTAYATYHFESEEKVWNEYLKEQDLIMHHQKVHHSFLPEVLKIQEENSDKSFHEKTETILLFLIRWLAFHIIDEDKRLSCIIKSLQNGKTVDEAVIETEALMTGSLKSLIDAVLHMYDNLSLKAISLIRERKARIKAEEKLKATNLLLEKLSITDQLTNIHNRRHFEDVFERELKRAQRHKTYLSVILFDIDFFKKLNDTYGHQKGDSALKQVANILLSVCKRPTDFTFRVGGEEFCIITTNENETSTFNLALLLQQTIDNEKIENKGSLISDYLTISAGIVCKVPLLEDTMDSIMSLADQRLYEAKNKGRNLIIHS